jgi:hypothetical protein
MSEFGILCCFQADTFYTVLTPVIGGAMKEGLLLLTDQLLENFT